MKYRKHKKDDVSDRDCIFNWLYDKGVYSDDMKLDICGGFAVEFSFLYNNHYNKYYNEQKMFAFIRSRFDEFCNYVMSEWNNYLSIYFN